MHLHSLLAITFWDVLEAVRPDVRFVYITHDLPFARSRRGAHYVLASPVEGLRLVGITEGLSDDVTEILLGAASLSFHARRVVLCEGGPGDRDSEFYGAWFNDRRTVVRAVGGSEMVHRCMSALGGGWLVDNVQAVGIIDRDFHTDAYLASLPNNLVHLPVHEIESLYCVPDVVRIIATHLRRPFNLDDYLAALRASVTDLQRRQVVIERWKRRLEPLLVGVVASVESRTDSLTAIAASLPNAFDASTWDFSPRAILDEERVRVETAITGGQATELLSLFPGKSLLACASQYLALNHPDDYVKLVNELLRDPGSSTELEASLAGLLPPRLAN